MSAADKQFLVDNAKKDGVTTTASGLQYKVIIQGEGAKPSSPATRVKVHYRGSLIDGSEFDSSYSRNQPLTFALNGVIAGWTEGLQLMPIGSKYVLYIPSELGYGASGAGGVIPPNATLIFEVELLDIL
jgi:FKBP-type peptidyl-prolyl cis-trans isomerase